MEAIKMVIFYAVIVQTSINIYFVCCLTDLNEQIRVLKEERNRFLELWKK